MVLTGASCWPSSKCILVQKVVSLSTDLNHNRSALVLDSDSDVCCHHSSSIVYQGSSHYGSRAKSDLRSHFTQPQNTFCQ